MGLILTYTLLSVVAGFLLLSLVAFAEGERRLSKAALIAALVVGALPVAVLLVLALV